MNQARLSSRLWLALTVMCIGIFAISGWGAYQARQSMLDGSRAEMKNIVSVAYGVVDHYQSLASAGKMPLEQAQRNALDDLRVMHYDGSGGYLIVIDPHAKVLMHGVRPDLDGKDMSGFTDPQGRHVFSDSVDLAHRSGEGYKDLLFLKPVTNVMAPKINYVKLYQPWDWTIVTGVFTDDIDRVFYGLLIQYALAAGLLCVVISALMMLIARNIHALLGGEPSYAADVVTRIADGELNLVVATRPGDSVSMLAALQRMQQKLVHAIGQIRDGAGEITQAAREIAAGNSDLSSRTEQQAASISETASSMEQLTATVQQNADNARQASQLARNASETAERGGSVVGEVVETMQDISVSSNKIVEIISVIEGIAFQTNILALNAAVEAARAGEEGRGFAVVAGEVRTLAQRSASAAKEIKGLIEESAGRIETGAQLVTRAGTTIADVVVAVRRVNDIMGEISAASEEQSSGIGQVNQAVANMDETTQRNAALVEEASASAAVLTAQTAKLEEAIAVFKLDGQAAVAAPTRAAQATRPAGVAAAVQRGMGHKPPVLGKARASAASTAAAARTVTAVSAAHRSGSQVQPQPAEAAARPAAAPKAAPIAPLTVSPKLAVKAGSDDDWETF